MSSSWARETAAVLRKEWLSESRSRHGLFTSLLFSLLAVFAVSLASFGERPSPGICAGMLCVTLLFSAVVAGPRTFLSEDESGTFDFLRFNADLLAVFWGKALFNVGSVLLTAGALALAFVTLVSPAVADGALLVAGVVLFSLGLGAGVSVCSALVVGASNKWVLGTAVSLPILLPHLFLGMGALRVAFGAGSLDGGWRSVLGLLGWAVGLLGMGPYLAAAAWRTDR